VCTAVTADATTSRFLLGLLGKLAAGSIAHLKSCQPNIRILELKAPELFPLDVTATQLVVSVRGERNELYGRDAVGAGRPTTA
jgi:hypothetical protein